MNIFRSITKRINSDQLVVSENKIFSDIKKQLESMGFFCDGVRLEVRYSDEYFNSWKPIFVVNAKHLPMVDTIFKESNLCAARYKNLKGFLDSFSSEERTDKLMELIDTLEPKTTRF